MALVLFQCFLICIQGLEGWGQGGVVAQPQTLWMREVKASLGLEKGRSDLVESIRKLSGVLFQGARHFMRRSLLVDSSPASHSWEIQKKLICLVD